MAGTKEIKRRIKSVKNTKKITKAMELVAASKMKRAVSQAVSSRPYATQALELLSSLASSHKEQHAKHPFFTEQPESKTLIVLITSNRGLCGAYNSQVIKKTLTTLKQAHGEIDFLTIGKKGDVAMRRLGQNIIATFPDLPNTVELRDILPISTMISQEYKNGTYSKVMVAYTDFISALSQIPRMRIALPISEETLQKQSEEQEITLHASETEYIFEGDPDKLLNIIAEKLVRMQIYQMIVESNASEQSARMMAMKNASEAAGEMIDDLTLAFNKARQAGITQEISEISAGMASVS